MNKILLKLHKLFGCSESVEVETLKDKVIDTKKKDLVNLRKTNGAIKEMIKNGEV